MFHTLQEVGADRKSRPLYGRPLFWASLFGGCSLLIASEVSVQNITQHRELHQFCSRIIHKSQHS